MAWSSGLFDSIERPFHVSWFHLAIERDVLVVTSDHILQLF